MRAVCAREDPGFGYKMARFNLEEEREMFHEDSGVLQSIPVVVIDKIATEWVINSHSH
jgi:hypothetical protein